MTDEQFAEIMVELRTIRAALLDKAKPTAQPSPTTGFHQPFDDIPQPTELLDDPDSVPVHFGKNAGTPIGSLSERSIEWYAKPKEPKIGKNGKPFAPRPADVLLENAARQIVHRRRGTLSDKVKPAANQTAVTLNDFDSAGDAF